MKKDFVNLMQGFIEKTSLEDIKITENLEKGSTNTSIQLKTILTHYKIDQKLDNRSLSMLDTTC